MFTPADGRFEVTGLPADEYHLCVSAVRMNQLSTCEWINAAYGEISPTFLRLATGQSITNLRMVLRTGTVIRIHVDDREFFLRSSGGRPGIFVENGRAIIHRASDWSRVTPENPAVPGEVIVIYATGLAAWPRIQNGFPAPVLNAPQCRPYPPVTIGGRAARVLFCGLAPGFVGLNQLNIEVPRESASGELVLEFPFPGGHAVRLPVR